VTTPEGLRIQGQAATRDLAVFPAEDEALGSALFSQVTLALKRGIPRPASFVFFTDSMDRFSLAPLAGLNSRARTRVLAGMAGQDDVECMAVLGAFRFRGKGPLNGQWVASVFIEWPDNRWWTAWQPIGPKRALVGDGPQLRNALDGSPRPGGVGGWFALARRAGLKLRVHRKSTPVH
jgi:hypothetical protein